MMLPRSPAALCSACAIPLLLFFFYVYNTGDKHFPIPKISIHTPKPSPFPRKIWQTWKRPASHLETYDAEIVTSWIDVNPSYEYELLTDAAALAYVQDRFAQYPRIAATYVNITDVIIRSDLLRYLLLFMEGGVYTDLDTKALKPVDSWIPAADTSRTGVVVGVEVDKEWREEAPDSVLREWSDGFQFQLCQWTMLARPGHPLLLAVINHVVDSLHAAAREQGVDIANVKLDDKWAVLKATGPLAWTDAILRHLNSGSEAANITKWDLHNLTEPVLVQDVMILPVVSFANSQGHSNAGDDTDARALVRHLWKSSWWAEHGGS